MSTHTTYSSFINGLNVYNGKSILAFIDYCEEFIEEERQVYYANAMLNYRLEKYRDVLQYQEKIAIDRLISRQSKIINEFSHFISKKKNFDVNYTTDSDLEVCTGFTSNLQTIERELNEYWNKLMVYIDLSKLSDDYDENIIKGGN